MLMRMHIASKLGRTLHELHHTMSGEEYGMWVAFYSRDHSEDG